MSRSRGLHPDTRLEVALNGRATRLAHEDAPLREAVAQLEEIANGRPDLLAAAAGQILGSYLSRPGSTHPQMVYAVALLVLAGRTSTALSRTLTGRRRRPRPRPPAGRLFQPRICGEH